MGTSNGVVRHKGIFTQKKTLYACFSIFWILTANLLSQSYDSLGDTRYVAEIPNVGILTLDLRKEYQGKRQVQLSWLSIEIPAQWELKDGNIIVYRLPAYSSKRGPDVAFILAPAADGSLEFREGGIIDAQSLKFFSTIHWLAASDPKSKSALLYNKARDQRSLFFKRGVLNLFSETFPESFMDVTAWLLRDREHEIAIILQYPHLSTAVLDAIGDSLLKEEAGQGSAYVLPFLGANPNISASLQDQLFAVPKNPPVWRAVACNPKASQNRYPEYLKRIREGDKSIRIWVARDQQAPREAWETALSPKEPEVLNEFARNPKAPSDMLEKVADIGLQDPWGLASNRSTPTAVLAKLSASTDKQVLWALRDNPSVPLPAVETALRTLATNSDSGVRDTACKDPRLPLDLMTKLSKDPSIQVRLILAMNEGLPLDILEALAKDNYRMVCERARDNIKQRFPDAYTSHQSEWVPLDQLNPHQNIIEDLTDAIKAGDVAKARAIIAFTDDTSVKPSYPTIVSIVVRENFSACKDLLKEAVINGGKTASETLVISKELKAEYLPWIIEQGLWDTQSIERLAAFATEQGRDDLLVESKKLHLLENLRQPVKDSALFSATVIRRLDLVKFWKAEGGNPSQPIRDRITAIDWAAKTYSIEVLRFLDADKKYASLLDEVSKEFPPAPNSPYLGRWSNKKDGFSTVTFILSNDGTGYMGISIASYPILWRLDGGDKIFLILIGPNGPMKDKPIQLQYSADKDVFTTLQSPWQKESSERMDPFYRIKKNSDGE